MNVWKHFKQIANICFYLSKVAIIVCCVRLKWNNVDQMLIQHDQSYTAVFLKKYYF